MAEHKGLQQTRLRAPRMSPDDRRATIVAAALPLVRAQGSGVLTADIARAAGIAEGTLFRVFPDKEALLGACLAHVADTAPLHARLDATRTDSLEQDVTQAISVVLEHLAGAMPVVMRVTSTGPTPRQARGLRARLTDSTREELAVVLARWAPQLSVPIDTAATVLHALVLGAAVQPEPPAAHLLSHAFCSGCAT